MRNSGLVCEECDVCLRKISVLHKLTYARGRHGRKCPNEQHREDVLSFILYEGWLWISLFYSVLNVSTFASVFIVDK